MKHKKIVILIVMVFLSYIVGNALVSSISEGRQKTLILIILSPMILAIPYFLSKFKNQGILGVILSLYWLPIPFILAHFGPFTSFFMFEFGLYAYIMMQYLTRRKGELVFYISDFPLMPFILFIFGALVTYLFSEKVGEEIAAIRVICILPLLLCFSVFITVESYQDAEKYLWILIGSASILGILFLFGQYLLPRYVTAMEYAKLSGRLSMSLQIPYIGSLNIDPASGDKFAFFFPIAFNFYINHNSRFGKIVAGIICLIFGGVLIYGQGRAGIMATIASTVLITFCSLTVQRSTFTKALQLFFVLSFIVGGAAFLAYHSDTLSFYERIILLTSDPTQDRNYIGRLELWQDGLYTFLENPFLGVGLFNFGMSKGTTWIVHNIWLFILVSFGMLGFIGFVWLIIIFLRIFSIGIMKENNPNILNIKVLGIASIITLFITGQFSPLVWEPYSAAMVWAPLAIFYATVKNENRRKPLKLESCPGK